MGVEYREMLLKKLKASDYNPRKATKDFDESLKRSLDYYGSVVPVVWNKRSGRIVGGHQRVRILLEQGVEKDVVAVVDLSDAEEKALNVSLNKLSGDWDKDKLREVLERLAGYDADLRFTGFAQNEIDNLMSKHVPAFEFDVEEVSTDTGVPDVLVSESHVRMVMLFFLTKETHADFIKMVKVLGTRYGKENLTDIVTEVIENAHSRRKG